MLHGVSLSHLDLALLASAFCRRERGASGASAGALLLGARCCSFGAPSRVGKMSPLGQLFRALHSFAPSGLRARAALSAGPPRRAGAGSGGAWASGPSVQRHSAVKHHWLHLHLSPNSVEVRPAEARKQPESWRLCKRAARRRACCSSRAGGETTTSLFYFMFPFVFLLEPILRAATLAREGALRSLSGELLAASSGCLAASVTWSLSPCA